MVDGVHGGLDHVASKTCGGGIHNYTRVCDNPKPSCGEECKGPGSNSTKCNDFCCPSKIIIN